MEPIELSENEQLRLFMGAVHDMSTGTSLWQKGADFCLQYDVAHGNNTRLRGSELMGYLNATVDNNKSKVMGLDLEPMIELMDQAIEAKVFTPHDKIFMFAKIVKSEALLYREDINRLLSQSSVRESIRNEFNEADPQRKEKDENLNRGYERLRNYEHEQIVRGGKSDKDVASKRKIRTVLGGKMTEGIYKGIAPHKGVTKGLPKDEITDAALKRARNIAHDNEEKDKLADKQEKLEKAGFVRKIINRKRQKVD